MQLDDSISLPELASLARHDPRASEELLSRVRQMALRYARARLGRFGAEDAAQDVAQEVCMAVLRGLPTYEERGLPFEAFVYTITARRLADAQRAAMRGAIPVATVPEQRDEAPTPEEIALVRNQADLALTLMEKLPAQQREILMLRVAVGLTARETAASLRMTPGAVRVAQHRALGRLREMMAQIEDTEVA
ncbi:MAG: sigma-70 family RNA polymerase sigma factor [Dermatophilaceae bacterium]